VGVLGNLDPLGQAPVSGPRALSVGDESTVSADARRRQALWQISVFVLLSIYAAIVIALASRHVFWRDEVRQFTFAIDNPFPQLLLKLRFEGHPALWFLILKLGWSLFHSVLVLPITSILIAAGATYLFLVKAPFPRWQKVLFPFGVLPVYEYSVMCRNYGISMLLLFAACYLYKDRLTHPFRYGLALILLANTNVHALAIAVGFIAGLALDIVLQLRTRRGGLAPVVASLVLVCIGALASYLSMRPDNTVTYTQLTSLRLADLPHAVLTVVRAPGTILSVNHSRLARLVIFAFGVLFFRHKQVFIIFLVATLGASAIVNLAYPAELRHKGVYICFLIALFWIDHIHNTTEPKKGFWPVDTARAVALPLMLACMIPFAAQRIFENFDRPGSSAKALGELVRANPALKDAILIGEPDYYVETVAYYLPNDIYIPGEERYGRRVLFTTASRQRYSLGDVLATAGRLEAQTGRPVILAIGHPLNPEGPFEIPVGYKRVFEYSPKSLHELAARTTKLAVFDQALGDENYAVYLVNR